MNALSLAEENTIALQIVQSALGLISIAMRAIGYTIQDQTISLHFLVGCVTESIQDDIEHIKFELDVLTDGKYLIEHHLHEARDMDDWPAADLSIIYKQKP